MSSPSAKKVARAALVAAFAAVRQRLLHVFDHPTDAEAIHKLRVSTRRAAAAVDAFAPCLPRRSHKCARRTLRTLRRTAGSARDWDVFFPVVSGWADTQPAEVRPFADALLGWAAAKRDTAQAGLLALKEFHPATLDAVLIDSLDSLRRPKEYATAAELGSARLAVLQSELAAALAAELITDADHHAVRVQAKRVRYAAELFPEQAEPGTDERMRELQEALGKLNDGVVGEQHLGAFVRHLRTFHPTAWERYEAGAAALAGHFVSLRDEARTGFAAWRTARLGERGA